MQIMYSNDIMVGGIKLSQCLNEIKSVFGRLQAFAAYLLTVLLLLLNTFCSWRDWVTKA